MTVPATRHSILLVDDCDALRNLVEAILCRAGYRVITAPDGESALQAIDGEAHVDLLLTDLPMPGIRGDVRATRFAQLYPEAASIVATSPADSINPEVACEFVPKPFSVDELRDAVRRTLQSKSMHDGSVETVS